MTKLSVNVNKLATLRNARGKNNPDVVKSSLDIIDFGSDGITVHPRPDARHIRFQDVYDLKKAIDVELNVEGYPEEDFLKMVLDVEAAQCTLVPDKPDAITSNAGWNVSESVELLKSVCTRLKTKDVRISVFVDPETMKAADYETLKSIGVDRVELYTEAYAENYGKPNQDRVIASYVQAANLARASGLGINAGHDLSLENLERLIEAIPFIDEVSIGHALVCDALYLGLEETIRRYKECIIEGTARAAGSK